jgi:CheY-like chemotaxis protein
VSTFGAAVMPHGRILVVDDDPTLREAISEALEEEGYEVSCAANGADALLQLRRGALPSVILLDLAMPVMDGWSFRRVQRDDPRLASVPTVVVSATHDAAGAALDSLRPDAFLPKPFELATLIAAIQRLR